MEFTTTPGQERIVAQDQSVEKISPDQNKKVWKKFTSKKADFFKHLAEHNRDQLETAGMSKAQIARMAKGKSPNLSGKETNPWMVHHVTPRTISGKMRDPNAFENLVLIKKKSELELHAVIDPQAQGMSPGQTRKVTIVKPNTMFWAKNAKTTREEARASVEGKELRSGKDLEREQEHQRSFPAKKQAGKGKKDKGKKKSKGR